MATGGEGSSFDYDEYTEEPGGGRAHLRYVNTDTIHASDSDDDRGMPQSPTEETLLSAGPEDDSAATSGEQRAKEGHSSSDEENDQSKSSGKMAKLFGKSKKKDGKDKSKDKKDKKDKDNKKEKKEDKKEKEDKKAKKEKKEDKKEKKEKKEDKKEKKEKKEEKKEKKEEAKEKKEKKKKAPKEEKEKTDDEKDETDEIKEKEKPRDRSPHRMPGFGKLGGFFKRNKKDSNTSNDSDITPPKQTSTPPSHRFTSDDVPRDISSDAPPHDQTFAPSEHSGATSAAANSDVFDEPEKVPLEEMDPRTRFRGPPPESIPMVDQPMGYMPPPMVPVSEVHVPPVPEDTTAPKTVPYTYTKGKPSISDKIRAPFNSILANKRSAKFQQGEGIAELNPTSEPPIARCSTFLLVVLVSGFILGIILTAMSSLSPTLAVVGPCFIGLSFFGLIGKIFFTLWWEEDPLPPLNKFNDQFHGFMKSGPNYQRDTYDAYPMYPVNSSQAALATYNVQSEVTETTPMTDEMALASDDVPDIPDIGLRFTDSDMDYARDSSVPSHDDSLDAYKRMRKDSISSDENVQSIKPSFV